MDVITEPFAVQAPLEAAGHIPVEVAVQAVPLGGSVLAAVRINHGIVLRAEVALQDAHHVVAELAGIDECLEVAGRVSLREGTAERRGMRPSAGRRFRGSRWR